MIIKKKKCNGCGQDKVIWKSQGREKYCKDCWFSLKPVKPIQSRVKLKPVADKKQVEDSVYFQLRIEFLTTHPTCEARLPGCQCHATEVHHKKGRGVFYLVVSTWLAVCWKCHQWITEHSKEAIELGLSESRNKAA